jgi:hypothetical protein
MAGPFYVAYADFGEPFSEAMVIEDEQPFAIEIDHKEGDFATLHLDVKNPRKGLLASDRKQWCWLSWDDGAGTIAPLFNGRIVGVTESLTGEAVRLQFIAKPDDYNERKILVAAELMVLPFYDPVFIDKTNDQSAPDPDTALEARSALWHVDRTTLSVTASDIIEGEDGTLDFAAADIVYGSLQARYNQPPLREIDLTATVSWTQGGNGSLDLTQILINAFSKQRSAPYGAATISSLTGDGLFGAWPKPRSNLGDGWSMSTDSAILAVTFARDDRFTPRFDDFSFTGRLNYMQPYVFKVKYTAKFPVDLGSTGTVFFTPYNDVHADFPVYTYVLKKFAVDYVSARKRTEKLVFSLLADVQPQIDPNGADPEILDLTSSLVGEAIDFNGGIPIGDTRRKSYFQTDRGLQSFEYLLLRARAKLRARARAVQVTFTVPWASGVGLSCRQSATVYDDRLPGGSATGKVTQYKLLQDAGGGMRAEIQIDCAIGNGGSVGAVLGSDGYVEQDYAEGPFQVLSGAQISPLPGELWAESLDDFEISDDGVDLLDMQAANVSQITVRNGLGVQCDSAIETISQSQYPDPIGVVKGLPTTVELQLANLTGTFITELAPQLSDLKIPKGIDLAAN